MPSEPKRFSRAEVALHNKADDLWIIVHGDVYDITGFLQYHPGGPAPLRYAGLDASKVFGRIHRSGILDNYKKFIIGVLNEDERNAGEQESSASFKSSYDIQADPDGYDTRKGGEAGREFGDHMAAEGHTGHISSVILVMYGAIAAYAFLASRFTGCSIWTIPIYYFVGMTAFYAWHLLAHSEIYYAVCKRAGLTYLAQMHEIHMEHHLDIFPPL